MKPHNFIANDQLDEAMPMGAMSKLGQTALTKIPFASQTKAGAVGKLLTGNAANKLMLDFRNWLGQSGEQATKTALLGFLSSQGYPTTKASQTLGGSPNQQPQAQPSQQPKTPEQIRKEKQAVAAQAAQKQMAASNAKLVPKESIDFRKLLDIVTEAMTEPVLSSKQISTAVYAAVQELAANKGAPKTTTSGDTLGTQSSAAQFGQDVGKNFIAATDAFINAGGKLTPDMKRKLQWLINSSI